MAGGEGSAGEGMPAYSGSGGSETAPVPEVGQMHALAE